MKNELGALMLWIDRKLNRNQDVLVKKIDSIQNLFETSAEATASSADILEGKTAYNGTTLITGTMENQGAKEATLLAGGTYNIPRGYHDGTGRVTATDLASQTPGTAAAGGILSGLKAWVAGQLINGSMKDRRGVTVTAGAVTQDDEYTYLTIPEEACFNASSKLRTKNSNIFGLKHKSVTLNPVASTPVTLEAMPNKLVIVIYYGAAAIYDVANKKFLLNRCDSAAGVGIDMIQNLQNNGKNFSVYYCHSASTPGEIYYL